MADYSAPFMPDMVRNTAAANGLQTLFDTQRTNADLLTAGKVAATGDLSGASSSLLGSGHLDEAAKLQGMARQMKDDHLRDAAATYEKMGNLALLAETPEQWQQALAAAQQHGIDTKGFEDFATGRPAAIALAKKTGDALAIEKSRRDVELAQLRAQTERFKGAESYQTTIKDENGVDVPAVRMRLPDGNWTDPVAVPKGIDVSSPLGIGKKAAPTTEVERLALKIQEEWAADHPDSPKVPYVEALAAARQRGTSGAGIGFTENANGVMKYTPEAKLGTRSYAYTPQGAYELKINQEGAKTDSAIQARSQLGSVIDAHAEQLRNIASSPDFNTAMMFLRAPDGVRYWTSGTVVAPGVPATAIQLKMIVQSLKAEYQNFVGAGHKGAIGEHADEQTRQIVDQLYQSPDAATMLTSIDTLQHLARAFQNVKLIGPRSVGGGVPEQQSTSAAAPVAPSTAAPKPKAAKDMTDEELKKALGL